MTANTQAASKTKVDVGYETTKFAFGVGIAAATMVGIWAVICMASVMLDTGLGGVIRGLIVAMTGS